MIPQPILRFATRLAAIPLAVASLAFSGCEKPPVAAPPPPVVRIAQAESDNYQRNIVFIGQLDSPQNVEVRARVESFLDKIEFTEGGDVKEGDLLFVLDKKPYEERLASANGRLAKAEAALTIAKIDVGRIAPLAASGATPQRDLDNAEAAVATAGAEVVSAAAQVKAAELDLGYCEIRAPLTGRIGAKQVPIGSLVGKGEPTLLATISQTDPIWFNANISEIDFLRAERIAATAGRDISQVPVTLILSDGTEHPHPGKWIFTDRAVDATTGTIRARAEFPDPEGLLRPGMFARVRITVPSPAPAILIPERALTELQGRNFVWVIGEGNKAEQRGVETADYRVNGSAIVLSGLEKGETIVIEGVHKLRDGAPVTPMPVGTAPASGENPPAAESPAAPTEATPE